MNQTIGRISYIKHFRLMLGKSSPHYMSFKKHKMIFGKGKKIQKVNVLK